MCVCVCVCACVCVHKHIYMYIHARTLLADDAQGNKKLFFAAKAIGNEIQDTYATDVG